MSKTNLAIVLGNWQSENGPRYHKLALSITRANERGDLLNGDRLPPERELAAALGISRSTVVSAYALLRDWKVVQSRRGGGTYVHSSTASKHRSPERFAIQRAHSKTDRVVLAGYLSPGFARVQRAVAEACDAETEIPYGVDALNHPGFARAVAGYYAGAGVPTLPEHITATTGVMQGMNIVIAELVQPGDHVLVATPTLMGVSDGLRRAGASLIHAQPGSARWHRMLESASPRVKLAVVSSCVSHPDGMRFSSELREEIDLNLSTHGIPILDVVPFFDLRLHPDDEWKILTSDRGNVITVSSCLRVLSPGLSMGWIRSSKELAQRFLRVRSVVDDGPSWIGQSAFALLLKEIDDARTEWTTLHRPKLEALTALLAELCPGWTFERPDGGATLWVRLPAPKAAMLAERCAEHGLTVTPGIAYGLDDEFADRVALSFSVADQAITGGVELLAAAGKEVGLL